MGLVRDCKLQYYNNPVAKIVNGTGIDLNKLDIKFAYLPESVSLYFPVTAEVYVDRLLNRKEFQAHCDRYKTYHAIIDNL